MDPVTERARAVRLAIFDVDGVMTDGSVYFSHLGEMFKVFNILDGHGLKMLKSSGIATAIISGRTHEAVAHRAKELEIAHVVQGSKDKSADFDKLLASLGVQASACAFVGDDVPDLPVMRRCGFAVAVANAHDSVKSEAHYVTRASGGRGAVREFCDLVLQAKAAR